MHKNGNANQIENEDVVSTPPLAGQGLIFNGTAYVPTNILLATDNTVLIRSESDLPAPVGGVITLVTGKVYIFVGLVDIANKLKPPTNGVVSLTADTIYGGINYTGSGSLFENTSLGTGILEKFRMTIKTPTGTVYDIDGGALGFIVATYVFFNDCDSLGTVANSRFTFKFCSLEDIGQGIIADANSGFTYSENFVQNGKNQASTSFISLSGLHKAIQVADNFFFTNGANESIFNITATLPVAPENVSAVINGNSPNAINGGSVFRAGSKTQTDIGWTFINNPGNPGISDSTITAETFFTGPVTTTIAAQNAWMIANLSGVISANLERIGSNANGTLTYTGLTQAKVLLNGKTNLEPSLSTNQSLKARYAVISPTTTSCTFTNATDVVNATAHGLSNGDTITFKNSAGTLPTELQKNVLYYVVNKADNTFQVSYTSGGAAVTFTNDGTPPNTYQIITLVGKEGSATIDINSPLDLSPEAISCCLSLNAQIVLMVRNITSANNNIVINSSYIRLNKV